MRQLEERELEGKPERSLSYYVEVEVHLTAGERVMSVIGDIDKDPKRKLLLADLADDLTSLLKKALDLFAAADKANPDNDPSWSDQPSIAPHAQNQHFREWSHLIELVRDSFTALAEVRPSAANGLLERWSTIDYPLFRRLTIHALTEWISQR
jgi:hypothetical protein